MKLRFFFIPVENKDGTVWLWRNEEVLNSHSPDEGAYSKYLGGAFHFDINRPEYCQEMLDEVTRLERGETDKTGWTGNAFFTDIYADRVEIEHQQFAGHPEWPMWTCTLAEFKAALEGWKRFLEMPVSLESEVIVELPKP